MKGPLLTILNMSIVSGLTIMGNNVISPVLPQYALTFSVPLAAVGWAVSAFAIARLGLNLPAGMLADRFGRKRVMIFGLILLIISSPVSAMATSYWVLILSRIVQGAGSAIYATSAMTWVAQISAGAKRGRLMSLYASLNHIGQIFGPTVGGLSAAYFDIRAPFWVYGGLCLMSLLATIPLKEPESTDTEKKSSFTLSDLRLLFKNTSLILVGFTALAIFSLRSGVRGTLIPLYGSLNLGLSSETIGFMLTVTAIASLVMLMPSGWISDKIGRKPPGMACMFMAVVAVMLMSQQSSIGGFLAALVFYGIAEGLQGAMSAWSADLAPRGKMGAAIGSYRVMGDLGMVLGPIMVTYAASISGGETLNIFPFVAAAAVPLVSGLLLIGASDPSAKRNRALD
jgi:DHA1 family multidrug resistance protein-like MFS transporter